MKHILTIIATALLCGSCLGPAVSEDLRFVWPEEIRSEKNVTLAFQLDKPFGSPEATLRICSANGYMVFLDDEMIAFGPARTAHGHIRKDEISLKGLTRGTHLTIDVIGNNVSSFCYADEKPFFAAEVISRGRKIASTEDFSCFWLDDRVQKVERFSYQRDFAEAYMMTRDRSCFYKGDRTMFKEYSPDMVEAPVVLDRVVPYPAYDRIPMTTVEDGDVFKDEDRPVWKTRFIDNIGETRTQGFRKDELDICISDEVSKLFYRKTGDGKDTIEAGTYTVTDAGRTFTGWFDLDITVKEPSLFYVIFEEIDLHESREEGEGLNINYRRNDCVGAVRYELEPGEYHLVNFEQFSARFLKFVCVKGSVGLRRSELISFENPEMFKLEFKCADDSLNAIVAAAQNTLAQNAVDLYTDCPQRERAGWLCDAFFSARAEFLMTGSNKIDRCFLENYAMAPQLPQIPEGMIPMCYPGDHVAGEFIPNWSMWYVLQLYDYFKRTGDRETVEMSRQKVEGLIEYFKKLESPEGLIENLEGWVFVEWSAANGFVEGINFPSNMMYSTMLTCAGELYGDRSLIDKGETIRKTVAELSFNGKFFEDNMIRRDGRLTRTGNISETCQYYAFFCGIADKDSYPELYETMFSQFGPGRNEAEIYPEVHKSNAFIGNYLRLEILRRYQRTGQMIDECKEFFYYMAERTHTLWEHSDPHGSLNHGFASYAANFIIEAVTGISDYDAGTKTLSFSNPGLELDCKASIPFGDDTITVDFRGADRSVTLPEGLKRIDRQ